ncbi:hypothetical protein D3C72_1832650 [compost metagenome]
MGGPEVVDVFDPHRFEHETGLAQALHHLFLAIEVQRGYRRTANQVAGQFKGRREVGWGRHGELRGKAGHEFEGGYLIAIRQE